MNIQEIKQKLNTAEYDFLRTNEHIKDKIMLLTLGGSYGYGTNVSQFIIDEKTGKEVLYESDLDIRGIIAPSLKEIIGLSKYDQFENTDTDTVLYVFNKMIELLLKCNPNVIEILGTKEEHILFLSEEGKLLRDNVDIFLSKQAAHSFNGYAVQQLRRLENALVRDDYPQEEKEKHILKSLQSNMEHLRNHYESFTDSSINLYIDDSDKEEYIKELFIDITLKHYPFRDYKNIFSEMGQTLQNFGQLNHRNKKKDNLHLTKHAMHLIRLYKMGTEVLEGKGINTYRSDDREFLLDIRNGKYTYEEIFKIAKKYEQEFIYAKNNSPLPDKPDYKKVEDLVMTINGLLLKKYNYF